jgi:hypothetical protein
VAVAVAVAVAVLAADWTASAGAVALCSRGVVVAEQLAGNDDGARASGTTASRRGYCDDIGSSAVALLGLWMRT